jgi:S1-C subfamily serine protease
MIQQRIARATLGVTALALAGGVLAGCGPGTTPSSQPSTVVQSLQQRYTQVVQQVGPAVVLIQTSQGLGSGIVFDSNGDIVTNNHVVANASTFQVTLADGKKYAAQQVGTFPADDLAVLRINATGLTPATFGDSSKVAVGDITLAIGNPLGLQSSVTEGIVSALGRSVSEGNGVALPNVIQTSAAINPGNSGGALVNLQGQVIGIPTLAATDPQLGGGAAPGIGFAIPSNTISSIATQLISQGKVTNSQRAYLGVSVATTTTSGGGVLVTQVQAGGPAAQAGIQTGEIITAINGTATPDPATLADVLAKLNPGQAVTVSLTSAGGAKQTVRVTLGQYPG